jgi:hypothetical protein
MNKSRYSFSFQWRSEFLKPRMLFFSVGKGAMNATRYWELRDDAYSAVDTSANTPRFSCPYGAIYLYGRVSN